MAKSKIQQTIRKSADGILDLSGGNVNIEVDDLGTIRFGDVFKKFDGEHVKIVVTVSSDGSEDTDYDG